ncbi:MAG: SsrA-binding protein SmpB [Desulfohalobiaceae bacterium]|nr:SsrA-binding protein SmpB [Desulfohalobiaceae bacterium]
MAPETSGKKLIAQNKKVRRYYDLLETFEAGLVLTGSEIKSIRDHKVSFKDSHVVFSRGEAYITGLHIAVYENAGYAGHNPDRDRKLLLHKREIDLLRGKVEQKGLTIVPTRIYLKRSMAKMEIALARGKKVHDQREELKRRAVQRDMAREMSRYK